MSLCEKEFFKKFRRSDIDGSFDVSALVFIIVSTINDEIIEILIILNKIGKLTGINLFSNKGLNYSFRSYSGEIWVL